jgi:hypothetical protein
MSTKKKSDEKRKMVNSVGWNTSIDIPTDPNSHSLRLRGKEVDISCSDISAWITIFPVTDITRDIRYCPHCGQRVVSEILFDKLKGVMPQTLPGKE